MDELRSWWEVPSIAHFCSLFRVAFSLFDFEIEELEEAFLAAGTPDGSPLLTDLLCSLLAGCYNKREIRVDDLPRFLYDIIRARWVPEKGCEHPIDAHNGFCNVPLRTKVEIVHAICDYRLDAEDVWEQLKGLDGDNLRLEPLGKDSSGALYWYFYGSRLYKEIPPPKPKIETDTKKKRKRESVEDITPVKKDKRVKKKKKSKDAKSSSREASRKKESKDAAPSPIPDGVRRSARVRQKADDSTRTPSKYLDSDSAFEMDSESEAEFHEESSDEEPVHLAKKSRTRSHGGKKQRKRPANEEPDDKSKDKRCQSPRTRRSARVARSSANRSRRRSIPRSSSNSVDDKSETDHSETERTAQSRSSSPVESTAPSLKSEMKTEVKNEDMKCLDNEAKMGRAELPNGDVKTEADHSEDAEMAVDKACDTQKSSSPQNDAEKMDLENSEKIEQKAELENQESKMNFEQTCDENGHIQPRIKPEDAVESKQAMKSESLETKKPGDSCGSWFLCCSTAEDWNNLAESFKDSTVKCEKDLYKTILEDFLPEIPRLIEEKEKLIKKRLMEMAPRRASTRIERKAELERIRREQWLATLNTEQLEQALKDEEDQRLKKQFQRELEEKRRKEAELERIENEKRAEEDRIRAKEERAERLKLREERARLIAEGKFIPPELSPRSNKHYKPEVIGDEFPVEGPTLQALKSVMNKLMEHHDAWLFRDPVDDEYAPGYYEVIDDPMDLTTMRHKLSSSYYRDATEFAADFKLVIDNCIKFNGFDSQCSAMAAKLEKAFHTYMNRYLPDLVLEKSELTIQDPTFREDQVRLRKSATQRAIDKLQKATNSEFKLNDPNFSSPRRKKPQVGSGDGPVVDLTGTDDPSPTPGVQIAPKLSNTTDSLKHRILNQFMHARLEKDRQQQHSADRNRFQPYAPKTVIESTSTSTVTDEVPTQPPAQDIDPAKAASIAMTPTTMYPKQVTPRYNVSPAKAIPGQAVRSSPVLSTALPPASKPSTPSSSQPAVSQSITPQLSRSSGPNSPAPQKKDGQKRYTIQTPYGSTITLNKPQRPDTPKTVPPKSTPAPSASPQVSQASIRLTKAQILQLLQQSPSLQKQLLANQSQGKPMVISNQQIYETISSQLSKILPQSKTQEGQPVQAKIVMRTPGAGESSGIQQQHQQIGQPQPQIASSDQTQMHCQQPQLSDLRPAQPQQVVSVPTVVSHTGIQSNIAQGTGTLTGQSQQIMAGRQAQGFLVNTSNVSQQQAIVQNHLLQNQAPQQRVVLQSNISAPGSAQLQNANSQVQALLQKQLNIIHGQSMQQPQVVRVLPVTQTVASTIRAAQVSAMGPAPQAGPSNQAGTPQLLTDNLQAARTGHSDGGVNAFLQSYPDVVDPGTAQGVAPSSSSTFIGQNVSTGPQIQLGAPGPQVHVANPGSVQQIVTQPATVVSTKSQASPKKNSSTFIALGNAMTSRSGTIKNILAGAAAEAGIIPQSNHIDTVGTSAGQVAVLSPTRTVNVVQPTTSIGSVQQVQPSAFNINTNTVIINTVPAVLGRVNHPNSSGGYPKLVHHYPLASGSFVQFPAQGATTPVLATVASQDSRTQTVQSRIVVSPTRVVNTTDGQINIDPTLSHIPD